MLLYFRQAEQMSFTVLIKGRSGVIFKESDMVLTFDAEMMAENIDLVIYCDSLQFMDGEKNGIEISEEFKQLVVDRVNRKLTESDLVCDWE